MKRARQTLLDASIAELLDITTAFTLQASAGGKIRIADLVTSLPVASHLPLWEKLQHAVASVINGDNPDVNKLGGVVDFAGCFVAANMHSIPPMVATVRALHQLAWPLDEQTYCGSQGFQSELASVCEGLWHLQKTETAGLACGPLLLYITRSLDIDGSSAMVKQVYSLREALDQLPAGCRSAERLIHRCAINPRYLHHADGIKFVAYALVHGSVSLIEGFYAAIKNQVVLCAEQLILVGDIIVNRFHTPAIRSFKHSERFCLKHGMMPLTHNFSR